MNTTTPSSFASYNLNNEIKRISTYILPFAIITTVITNMINIIILTRRTLRSSPCTHYFLALAIASLIYMGISPLSLFLTYQFNIILSNTPFGCSFQPFLVYASSLFVALIIAIVWQQGTYVFATFLYILSGSVYREELKKLFKFNNYIEQQLRQVTTRLRTYIETNN
ncbi:hypothetical protein I4U23_016580 [Adineta vaga]|nr:hypothetical protein I4U23_016580 [Adineta vaga]